MTAAFMVAAIALLALAIDVGRLYAAQQKLQSTANLAALAAARRASGCRPQAAGTGRDAALDNVLRNHGGSSAQATPALVAYDTGHVSTDPGSRLRRFSADADGEKPNAVRLALENSSFTPLFSLFSDSDTTLRASAGAISQPQATLQLGTTLATVDPALLSGLIGINIAVASAGDLGQVSVSLAQLIGVDAALVTPEDIARITIGDALGNAAGALNSQARQVVSAVRDAAGGIPLSDVFAVAGRTAGDVRVGVGAIVNAAAQAVASERESAIPLPPLELGDLPAGLGGVTAQLRILQPLVIESGPAGRAPDNTFYTAARAAQAAIVLRIELSLLGAATLADVPIVIEVAGGEAGLREITCATAAHRRHTVGVDVRTATATAGIGTVENGVFVPGEASLLNNSVRIRNAAPSGLASLATDSYSDEYVFEALPADIPQTCPEPASAGALNHPGTRCGANGATLDVAKLTGLLRDVRLVAEIDGDLPLIEGLLGGDEVSLTSDILLAPINAVLATLGAALAPANAVLSPLGISLSTATTSISGLNVAQPTLFCASASACGFDAD